jgi:hypothetical protein
MNLEGGDISDTEILQDLSMVCEKRKMNDDLLYVLFKLDMHINLSTFLIFDEGPFCCR